MSKTISLEFEYEHDYTLLGIHSSLEDYRMAFFLNRTLNLNFKRNSQDLDFQSNQCKFSTFDFEDDLNQISWSLITNKFYKIFEVTGDSNLFSNETQISYLIPELKKIDYFIKINGLISDQFVQEKISMIKEINNVITLYTINPLKIKSRDNLIY